MDKQKHGYSEHKDAVLKRLRRAEGQVRGISKMVENDEYCIDILTQVSAARAALDNAAIELLRDHAKHCMMNAKDDAEKRVKADELVTAVGRLL